MVILIQILIVLVVLALWYPVQSILYVMQTNRHERLLAQRRQLVQAYVNRYGYEHEITPGSHNHHWNWANRVSRYIRP